MSSQLKAAWGPSMRKLIDIIDEYNEAIGVGHAKVTGVVDFSDRVLTIGVTYTPPGEKET